MGVGNATREYDYLEPRDTLQLTNEARATAPADVSRNIFTRKETPPRLPCEVLLKVNFMGVGLRHPHLSYSSVVEVVLPPF